MSATVIILVLIARFFSQFVCGYNITYQGFDACGMDGWHCKQNGSDLEVSFECNDQIKDARLWIWTARVPHSTTILSVKNCRRVELHMDCTMGHRYYKLRQFRAENIAVLELLRPLRPHIFLHDNDMYSQAPAEFIFTNVSNLKWYPENFKAMGGRCQNKQRPLEKLYFENVFISIWSNILFKDQRLQYLYMGNVRFGSVVPSGTLSVEGPVAIRNCDFTKQTKTGAFNFKSTEMDIKNNKFDVIPRDGITIAAKYFSFTFNKVNEAQSKSFVVVAQGTRFINNDFEFIRKGAFSDIKPKTSCISGNSYEFRDNQIKIFEKDFAPDMNSFMKNQCSQMSITNNTFTCDSDCLYSGKNVHPDNYEELFGIFSNSSNDNVCQGYPDITMKERIMELSVACGLVPTPTLPDTTIETTTTEIDQTATMLNSTLNPGTENPANILQSTNNKSTQIAIPLSVGAVLLIVAAIGTSYWIYKKRRNPIGDKVTASFQHAISTRCDHDQLINDEDDEQDCITIR